MGMYTEIYVNCAIKQNTPQEVIDILKFLFDGTVQHQCPEKLPNHQFFSCVRWKFVGSSGSYSHIPFSTSRFDKGHNIRKYYITSRSDLKNYDGEIECFFDWVMPYVCQENGDFIGYHRFEEAQQPILVFKYCLGGEE